eukprot:g11580.t1
MRRWRQLGAFCLCGAVFLPKPDAEVWLHRPSSRATLLARAASTGRRAPGENPYDILGLPRGCTPEEIKPAFRQLAREMHPDEKFKQLVWAMRELTSEKGRKKWAIQGDLMGVSLQEMSLESEDFAFDMRDWPFEELEDLLRLSEEAMDVSEVRTTWSDDGFLVEDRAADSHALTTGTQ